MRERPALIDRALAGELAGIHPASFAWALTCCGFDRQEAEDVLQTAYLKMLDGRARFDGRSSLKTWLFAVVRRTAVDLRRRRWVASLGLERLFAAFAPASSDEPAMESDERARVRAALARLSRRQREVLDLVFYHDFTVEEAARIMNVSVGAARVHYQRGKARLRGELR
ncbi:MAG: polymerase sigma factor, sigma-70 family [Myxococcales bacterium]|nr:polymerase sigma factor, sigma-70 family [Myxococcales bacterium]